MNGFANSVHIQNLSFHNIYGIRIFPFPIFILLPNESPMKYFFLIAFFALTTSVFGQNNGYQETKKEKPYAFKLYPNPAIGDYINIKSDLNAIKVVKVYNVFGKVVLTDRISNNVLNISRLVPGIYVLQVTEKGQSMTQKLVVK